MCVHHEANVEPWNCALRALGRRFTRVCDHVKGLSGWRIYLPAYYVHGIWYDVSDHNNMWDNLKRAAKILDYPDSKGIPIDRIDTHSLRTGGVNTLALSGYSDCQIQKNGRWCRATFREYIREELACYSEDMSKDMKNQFRFVNIAAGAIQDVSNTVIIND